ncbi:hypothetical protein Cgig2_025176 [Carnegiea gigantea]|uniref:AB hydrolase-1 domain-containing protein n=1 Tax=Carnegiea gigantea TaxID=171969 RepID=A0A9Q1KRV1_9CARY|nr:hypothetical protein Cgig2_025176 [Carnegiea gigantea]
MGYAKLIRQYLFMLVMAARQIVWNIRKLKDGPVFMPVVDFLVFLYYYFYCGLTPCAVDLDDQTTMNFWISNHRRHDRPNLVIIHGCGADAALQFSLQAKTLSKSFNLYIPDLLFFGKSYTKCKDRSTNFQAKCVMQGLKRGFGVENCSVFCISYGGWVGYWMADMYPDEVEKIVIVSTGIGSTAAQKLEQLKKVDKRVQDIVIPRDPEALRFLVKSTVHKYDLTRVPEYFFWDLIMAKENKNRIQKEELIEHVMLEDGDSQVTTLSQETLLVWGENDLFFPKHFAYQLQRRLEPKVRLEMLKETGHAANVDSPRELNELIISFILEKPGTRA